MTPKNNFDASRTLPWLLILFAGSGCSALIYEIVWYQLLQLVIGSTTVSLGVLLATFMGGLCIGSLWLPRYLAKRPMHPLRAYARIELGIGLCGILELAAIPLVDSIYASAVTHGLPSIVFRAVICAICLLPPTILMGASLPAIARWIEATPRGVSWMGLLYGGNTAGAVLGCLLAGFVLLRVSNMTATTFAAAAINLAVALFSFALAKTHAASCGRRLPPSPSAFPGRRAAPRLHRHRDFRRHGSRRGSCLDPPAQSPARRHRLHVFDYSCSLPGRPRDRKLGRLGGRPRPPSRARPRHLSIAADGWNRLGRAYDCAVRTVLAREPAAFQRPALHLPNRYGARRSGSSCPPRCSGARAFPLALAAAAGPGEESSSLVGRVYAANTGGAILGALVFSLLLVPAARHRRRRKDARRAGGAGRAGSAGAARGARQDCARRWLG